MAASRGADSGARWHYVGKTTDFANVSSVDAGVLSQLYACGGEAAAAAAAAAGGGGQKYKPGCRAFILDEDEAPGADGDSVRAAEEMDLDSSEAIAPAALRKQVLVFRYNGKFHAIDHQCPHSSFPLSRGTPFDIEDFGVVLSAGINCPKHGWSFDLYTGQGDRGNYLLNRWDVDLRPGKEESEKSEGGKAQEVWVRRRVKP